MADRRATRGDLPRPLRAWYELGLDEDAAWRQAVPGPHLGAVAERLGSTPSDFLDERIDLAALASDVFGTETLRAMLPALSEERETLRGAAVGLWLLASQHVVAPFDPPLPDSGVAVAALGLRLAPVVPPRQWLVDVARREEAARLFLLWCGRLPAGEDADTARSLARRLDSLARNQALASMATEHAHRLAVQRRLREQRAAEAAARYTHE